MSRTATTRKMARIFAMVKKSDIKLFKEVAAEAKKEIIKAIIKGASEQISGYIGAHL